MELLRHLADREREGNRSRRVHRLDNNKCLKWKQSHRNMESLVVEKEFWVVRVHSWLVCQITIYTITGWCRKGTVCFPQCSKKLQRPSIVMTYAPGVIIRTIMIQIMMKSMGSARSFLLRRSNQGRIRGVVSEEYDKNGGISVSRCLSQPKSHFIICLKHNAGAVSETMLSTGLVN